jgi:hypothetical protein
MACVFAVRVQSWLNITRVVVLTFKVTVKLSRYCYFINSTGAVSRYKLSRSQKLVKVQKYDWKHWREVRVPRSAGAVLVAGVKAKTMTNNLPILSVLAVDTFYSITFGGIYFGLKSLGGSGGSGRNTESDLITNLINSCFLSSVLGLISERVPFLYNISE